MIPTNYDHVLAHRPLEILVDECQGQIQEFRRKQTGDSPSCAEIVRRAANGDNDALTRLLHDISLPIITPIIKRKCPTHLRYMMEDIAQETHIRLFNKFHNVKKPFNPKTFAAYRKYLNMTIKSVILNLERKEKQPISLDGLQEKAGIELSEPAADNVIERREIFRQLLTLLVDPLECEVLRRRLGLGETPDEIVQGIQTIAPDITKQDVYRLTEHALFHLQTNPAAIKLLQELR